MRKILYAKYNRTRVPRYQTATVIVEEDGEKYVEKKPLVWDARQHVADMAVNYIKLKELYSNVHPCPCRGEGDSVVFDYLGGDSIADLIEGDMDALDHTLELMKQYVDKIFCYRKEQETEFQSSDAFETFFGKIKGIEILKGVRAVKGADIDLILDNIFVVNDQYYCIDYEWYVPFSIPISFVIYRALRYFYEKNRAYFQDQMHIDSFLKYFQITDVELELYRAMDEGFQQTVHGQGWRNIYTARYEKNAYPMREIMNRFQNPMEQRAAAIRELDDKAAHLSRQVDAYEQKNALCEQKIASCEQKIAEYEQQINLLKEQCAALHQMNEQTYHDLTTSLSWRITAPIRACGRWVNSLKGKG